MATAPGWYPDPHDHSKARYWDGQAWTDQTQALETRAPDREPSEPLESRPPTTARPTAEASTRIRTRARPPLLPIGVGLLALLVVGVAAFLLVSGGDDNGAGGESIGAGSTAEEESAAGDEEGAVPEEESTPPEPEPEPEPGSISYEPYTPSDSAFAYDVVLPSGADWSRPRESRPTEGALLRVSVRGPAGLLVLVDRTPFEVPALTTGFDSRKTVRHPAFGTAERYVISRSELIPECGGSPCVDYLVNDRTGGGWAVLAGGGDDLALADTVAKRVANSLQLP